RSPLANPECGWSSDPASQGSRARTSRDFGSRSRRRTTSSSRWTPTSPTSWSSARVALSRAGNLYARLLLGFPIRDATSGFRVYRGAPLARLLADPSRSDGYGFQIELAFRAWREGFDVAEVPITFREREHGHSKISRRIVLEALWLVTLWGLKARLGPVPRPLGERP